MSASLTIVFPIYPGLTHLDFTGPHQFLSQIPHVDTIVASAAGGTVDAGGGLAFAATRRLEEIPACDVLCVPGGNTATDVALDPDYLIHIRRLGEGARYVTSVCTGSLILGAAGLLQGRRAACHWQWRHLLPLYGATPVHDRVVRDGNVITGGGVTAGIDFALTLVQELCGDTFAQALQLGFEYAPAPPFTCGSPDTAPPEILAIVREAAVQQAVLRDTQVRAAAARLPFDRPGTPSISSNIASV